MISNCPGTKAHMFSPWTIWAFRTCAYRRVNAVCLQQLAVWSYIGLAPCSEWQRDLELDPFRDVLHTRLFGASCFPARQYWVWKKKCFVRYITNSPLVFFSSEGDNKLEAVTLYPGDEQGYNSQRKRWQRRLIRNSCQVNEFFGCLWPWASEYLAWQMV